jgi:hypothetical protein
LAVVVTYRLAVGILLIAVTAGGIRLACFAFVVLVKMSCSSVDIVLNLKLKLRNLISVKEARSLNLII